VDDAALKISNLLSSWILFATVAAAPLPFGSTSATATAFWCVVLGIGLIAASARNLDKLQLLPLAVVAVVVAAYCVVLHEQLSDAPWFPVAPDPAWSKASELLNTAIAPSPSLAKNEPWHALGAPLAALLAFATGYVVCAERTHAHTLLQVAAWSGTAYAAIGIASFLIDPTRLLWREKLYYLTSLTGPFINRNTAAVYFGSCLIVCLLLFLKDLGARHHDQRPRLRDVWRMVGADGRQPSWPLIAGLVRVLVLATALLMTQSRAGVVFSLLGLVLAFVLFQARGFSRRQHVWLSLALGLGLVLSVLQVLGSGSVGARFDSSGLGDAGRLETYRSTWRLIADHPWLGTGQGTFVWSFPPYRDSVSVWGIWNRAHNTLFEIAADMGLPLALLVAVAWALAIGMLIRGIWVRRRDLIIPIAALAIVLVSVAHTLIDFSLQIPGYSIVVFAILGAGIAQSYAGRSRQPRDLG
jgi:O-antigen ligase